MTKVINWLLGIGAVATIFSLMSEVVCTQEEILRTHPSSVVANLFALFVTIVSIARLRSWYGSSDGGQAVGFPVGTVALWITSIITAVFAYLPMAFFSQQFCIPL